MHPAGQPLHPRPKPADQDPAGVAGSGEVGLRDRSGGPHRPLALHDPGHGERPYGQDLPNPRDGSSAQPDPAWQPTGDQLQAGRLLDLNSHTHHTCHNPEGHDKRRAPWRRPEHRPPSLDTNTLYVVKRNTIMYTVYMLQCADGSLYTGIAKNLDTRLSAHTKGIGSKYVRARLPFSLVYTEEAANRSIASKRETEIKKLPRDKKLILIDKK